MIKQEAIGMSCGAFYGSKSKLISIRWIKIKRHFAVWQIADQKVYVKTKTNRLQAFVPAGWLLWKRCKMSSNALQVMICKRLQAFVPAVVLRLKGIATLSLMLSMLFRAKSPFLFTAIIFMLCMFNTFTMKLILSFVS
ncbi:unnamed protein product [Prunus brigantina]